MQASALSILLLCSCMLAAALTPNDRFASTMRRQHVNNRPIVGILSQYGLPEDEFLPKGHTYIASSYIKFVEGGGARVVPILPDTPSEALINIFSKINGFLIPGGAANLRPGHGFFDTTRRIFDFAVESNNKGDHFPIIGICLGFEALNLIVAGTHDILQEFDAEHTAAPLYFTEHAPTSNFFGSWDLDLAMDVLKQPLARESHQRGIGLNAYHANDKLREFFYPLSLSVDNEGRVFISTIEAANYPFVGVQWHPEKNAYEWSRHIDIPHGYIATEVTHQSARFFVNETRRSTHKFEDAVEEDLFLIYNDKRVFSGKHKHKDDRVWADEVVVLPPWHEYREQLAERAKGTDHESAYRMGGRWSAA